MRKSHLIVRAIVAVTGIVIVSGCGATLKNSSVRPSVSPASIVQVNQRLDIPNRNARVFIQDGAVSSMRNIDEWSTYCSVLLQQKNSAGKSKLSVSPGQFTIVKVIERENYIGSQRTYVASLGWGFDLASNHHDGPVVFEVEMRLASKEQPGVRALICEKRSDNRGLYNYPTLEEIKVALGNLIEIKTQ